MTDETLIAGIVSPKPPKAGRLIDWVLCTCGVTLGFIAGLAWLL